MITECRGRQCFIPASRRASDTAMTITYLQLRLGGSVTLIQRKVTLMLFIILSIGLPDSRSKRQDNRCMNTPASLVPRLRSVTYRPLSD